MSCKDYLVSNGTLHEEKNDKKTDIWFENVKPSTGLTFISINRHYTVVCSITWPMNASEAGGDLALIQTSVIFS